MRTQINSMRSQVNSLRAEVNSIRAQLDISKRGESNTKVALTTTQRECSQSIYRKDKELKDILKTTVDEFKKQMSGIVAKDETKTGKLTAELARKDKRIADLLKRMETRLEQLEKRKRVTFYELDFEDVGSDLQKILRNVTSQMLF